MNKIKKNYIYNISYQLFALLVPLITTPYISRVLGVDGIGIYSYSYSMVRYFWLLSALGISTFGIRTVAVKSKNVDDLSLSFWNIFSLKVVLFLIFGLLYISYSLFIADNKIISLIQGIYLIGVLFDISWFFQGLEDFKKVSLKNTVIKIINVFFIFIFIKSKNDLQLYIFGLAFFQTIGNISMWFSLKKYIKVINIKNISPFSNLKSCIELFIPSVASQIFAVFDKSMIGWITRSSLENGYYEQAFKIVDMSLVLITTIGTIMIPSISRAYKNKEMKKIDKFMTYSVRFVYMLSLPMIFGLLAISRKFVPIFFGNGYEKSIVILNILSLLFLIMGLNTITGTQYLVSTDKQNVHTKCLIIGGVINLIFNIILIKRFNSIGAAIASVFGEMCVLILESGYLKKKKYFDLLSTLKYSINYVFSSLIMFIILLFLIYFVNSLIELLFCILVGGMIYLFTLIMLRDEFVIHEIKKIFKRRLL